MILDWHKIAGLILCLISFAISVSAKSSRALVLVDPFTSYLSGHCTDWCKENGVKVVEAVSEYSCATLGADGQIVPASLRAPPPGEEMEWAEERGIVGGDDEGEDTDEDEPIPHIDDVFVISESDSGTTVAERIQSRIGAAGNGHSPQLRDKAKQNDMCRLAGLPTNKQVLASSWKEAEEFLDETLWKPSKSSTTSSIKGRKSKTACVVKPNRGVASDGVTFCISKEEVKKAFNKILASPAYGEINAKNQAVLVQEFTPGGEEYAVDTVTCGGVTRVAALWRYEKIKANGSPFIYQCSELIDVDCDNERDQIVRRKVVNYAVKALQAQGLKYGPCHIEVKVHPRTEEPKLMEINARWHAQPFLPVVEKVLPRGLDALTLTMESFFDRPKFLKETREAQNRDFPGNKEKEGVSHERKLNHAPPAKEGGGMIVHLVQKKGGIVRDVKHLEQIEALPSVVAMSHDAEVGEYLAPTSDHRSHSGYVVLAHKDEQQVKTDYAAIMELQARIVEFMPEPHVIKDQGDKERRADREKKVRGKGRHAHPSVPTASQMSAALPTSLLGRAASKVRRATVRALWLSGLAYTSLLAGVLLLPEHEDL